MNWNDPNNNLDNPQSLTLSNTELDKKITGSGDNQIMRVYMDNQSSSNDNSGGTFKISAPQDNTYLDYGDFIFEFGNSFTTNHTLEDDSAPNRNFNLSISSDRLIGLEFDIRGNNTIINGFYAWISTVNATLAENTSLNISIYKSSELIPSRSSLEDVDPKNIYPSTLEYSTIITDFIPDDLNYFDFPDTVTLDSYNYFLVLGTNNTLDAYRLVVYPSTGGDGDNEHVLEVKDGGSWWIANITRGAQYRRLDASSFTLNVTRGFMPSDFIINTNKTLRIQNIPLNNNKEASFPYIDANIYQWGLGSWNAYFPNLIPNDGSIEYLVSLTWNKTGTGIDDFDFNVSYSILVYSQEDSIVNYYADYNGDILWTIDYTLNLINYNWNFTELWFLYPSYHDNISLITPSTGTENVLDQTLGESTLNENLSLDKLIIPYNLSNFSGTYQLNLTSYNALNQIHSYIYYQGNLLETSGFMYGDIIKAGVDISGPNIFSPDGGTAQYTFYNPDQSINDTFSDSTGTLSSDKTLLNFDFNNRTLLFVDKNVEYGTYYLGMFWENGSLIGINNVPIYIEYYDLSFSDVVIKELENRILIEDITRFDDIKENYYYYFLGASINKTDQFPQNFYAITLEGIDQHFSYEISGTNIDLEFNDFLQNESILNPSEEIKFKITMKNNNPIIKIPNVKVSVKLVSPINDNWIMTLGNSTSQTLEILGDPNGGNQKEFLLSLQMPDINPDGIWKGYNSPIRLGGAKAIVTVYIDNEPIHTYNSPEYSLLVNKTDDEFEGYILSLSETLEGTSTSTAIRIPRNKCIYAPDETNILINIQDYNHISSYELFNNSYLFNESSKFEDISTNPDPPIKGESFNLSSRLTSEFGEIISGEIVNCYYYNGTHWRELDDSPKTTDINGITIFEIDTNVVTVEDNKILFRLSWEGSEEILNRTQEFNITLFSYTNELTINARIRNPPIYRNADKLLDITLINTGNSNLNISSIILTFADITPSYEIMQQDISKLERLRPGVSTLIIFKILFKAIPSDVLTINISVTANNINTQETIVSEKSISESVINNSIFQNLRNFVPIILISLLALIVGLLLWYSYVLKRRIETPVAKPAPKKKRRGVYKKVSEIKKATPEKEEEAEEKEKTDLDSLLEEEGI